MDNSKLFMFLNLENPNFIFISANDNGDIKIVRPKTENNINYWSNRCKAFFIYETNKIEQKVEISKSDVIEYLRS